jgi:5'-3' exonuclease
MNMLVEWGSKVIYSENNEADDAIASFVASNIDKEMVIATTDKDLWQLCEIPHVKVFNFQKSTFVGKKELKESFELDDYTHIKLHKALWGDVSDNVPNLAPRLGRILLPVVKKTDGSLRDFWEKVEENKNSLTEKCLETLDLNKEKIRINYELVRLNFDCDVIFEIAKLPAVKEKHIPLEITEEVLKKIF